MQALKTRLYAKQILHENVDSTCHLCHHCDETLDHLLSSFEVLAKTEYISPDIIMWLNISTGVFALLAKLLTLNV